MTEELGESLGATLPELGWLDGILEPLLAPGYLDGIDDRPLEDLRAMRAATDEVELTVSFLRRVAQGRLDVVHSLMDRRHDGANHDLAEVVEGLPGIMAGPPRLSGSGRFSTSVLPDTESVELSAAISAVLDVIGGAEQAEADEVMLQSAAELLGRVEVQLSARRRALHQHIDRLQTAIVERYTSGRATVDGLLS
jgi:hypothetical protein